MNIASYTKPDPIPAWATLNEQNNWRSNWYYFKLDLEHPEWKAFYAQQETSELKRALEAAGFEGIYKMPDS